MSEPIPSTTSTTSRRRTWLLVLAAVVAAIGLAGIALSDLRRAPAAPAKTAASISAAPLADAPHVALQPPSDDARVLERARRKAMRNAEVRADGQQPTSVMNAWKDAFAGKPPANTAPRDDHAHADAPHVAPRLRRLAERVNLTPEQLDALALALGDERTQIATLREQRQEGTLTHEQTRAQIDALRERTDAKVAHVLDAEQLAAFSEMRDHGNGESAR
jgi:hypothetical protein